MSVLQLSQIQYGSPEYAAAFALREEVLRKPLGLSLRPETLQQVRDYLYLACHVDGELVGLPGARCRKSDREIRMRQVAVAPRLQGQGIGRALVEFAEQFARERGFTLMTLHARDTAIPFYEKLGYECVGEPFVEVTILHQAMQKRLSIA